MNSEVASGPDVYRTLRCLFARDALWLTRPPRLACALFLDGLIFSATATRVEMSTSSVFSSSTSAMGSSAASVSFGGSSTAASASAASSTAGALLQQGPQQQQVPHC